MLDWRIRTTLFAADVLGKSFRPDTDVNRLRAGYREMNTRFGLRPKAAMPTRDLSIPGADGTERPARLYLPPNAENHGLLLYFHGGGWVIGDIDCYDHLTRFLAHSGKIAVLSASYRLGPEHRFPAAHDDALAIYAWVCEHAEDLGVQKDHVAVGGDSAGGGLAGSLCIQWRENHLPRPAAALLIYPSADGHARGPSRAKFSKGVPLTPEMITWFAKHYFRDAEDLRSPRVTLIDAHNLADFPPTMISAAAYDPLLDEGALLASRLRDAGVRVRYDLHPTLSHGFVNMAGIVPSARQALLDAIVQTVSDLTLDS